MVTTVDDLITARSADDLVTEQLAVLTTEEFPADSWQVGSVPRTLVLADATALAALDSTVADLARAAFLDDATGDWLTLLAASRFTVTRVAATYTVGRFLLTVASGAGPYTIGAAGLLVTNGTVRFRSTNTASVTVTSAATTSIEVRAEVAGTAYNIAVASTLTIVSPAYAGLTVTNPVYAAGDWKTTSGAAAQSDASLRAACRAKWATLGRGATLAAYEYWATTSSDTSVTRANAVPGAGDGTLIVYIAQSSTAATGGMVSAVQSYVDSQKPVTDTPTVTAATAATTQVVGSVRFTAATYDTTAAHEAIETAVTAYITTKGFGDTVDLGGVYHTIYAATPGVADVDLSLPGSDTTLTASQIGAASVTLTYSS